MTRLRARPLPRRLAAAALAASALSFALTGCSEVTTFGVTSEGESSGQTALIDAVLVLAAVASLSPDACADGASDGFATSPLNPDQTTKCTTVKLDEKVEVTGGTVELTTDSTGGQVVMLDIDEADEMAELTGAVAEREAPENQIAIMIGREVVSAPVVMAKIDGGELQISGGDAQALFDALAG